MTMIPTQAAHNDTGTSPEDPVNVLMSRTYRRLSGDSQGNNTTQHSLNYTSIPGFFYKKNKYSKVLNGNVHGKSIQPSCRRFSYQMMGRSADVHGALVIHVI